jgi:hypothetical protein
MTDELEEIERKRSWPNPGIIQNLAGGTEENRGVPNISRGTSSYNFSLPY